MSDLTLEAYAQDLIADVLATAEAESATAPETFTRRALDDLEQAGVTENTFTAYYSAHGVEVSGYGSNESLGTPRPVHQLFQPVPGREQDAPRPRPRRCSAAPLSFVQRCRDGLRHADRGILRRLRHVPGGGEDAAGGVHGSGCSCSPTASPPSRRCPTPASTACRSATRSGTSPGSTGWRPPAPSASRSSSSSMNRCPAWPRRSTDRDFSVFLTILPGSTLPGSYGQYGTRLLELNVRSFLQAKGAVNRGIRDTLLTDPERFLAYNNGITATASNVEFTPLPGGGQAIRRIHDLQIVNGGQTTASIHYAHVRDKADICRRVRPDEAHRRRSRSGCRRSSRRSPGTPTPRTRSPSSTSAPTTRFTWKSRRSPDRCGRRQPTAAAKKPAGSTSAPAASTPTRWPESAPLPASACSRRCTRCVRSSPRPTPRSSSTPGTSSRTSSAAARRRTSASS